jgi:hypothetical protein
MIRRCLHGQIGMRREEHRQPRGGEEIGHATIGIDTPCLALDRHGLGLVLLIGYVILR